MAVFKNNVPLVLASASPRRRELLGLMGLAFTIRAASGESGPRPGESGAVYAARAAGEKALAVLEELRAEWDGARRNAGFPVILGADTVVALDGEIFGKPADAGEALLMLQRLSGRTHEVITACRLLLPGPGGDGPGGYSGETLTVRSRVTFWDAPAAALRAYARSGESLDKAGAYAVQGQGAFLARRVEGSWSNVVGLPLSELAELMLARGLIAPVAANPSE